MYFACFYVLKGKDKFSVHLKKFSVQTRNLSTLEAGGGGLTLALATHWDPALLDYKKQWMFLLSYVLNILL